MKLMKLPKLKNNESTGERKQKQLNANILHGGGKVTRNQKDTTENRQKIL